MLANFFKFVRKEDWRFLILVYLIHPTVHPESIPYTQYRAHSLFMLPFLMSLLFSANLEQFVYKLKCLAMVAVKLEMSASKYSPRHRSVLTFGRVHAYLFLEQHCVFAHRALADVLGDTLHDLHEDIQSADDRGSLSNTADIDDLKGSWVSFFHTMESLARAKLFCYP